MLLIPAVLLRVGIKGHCGGMLAWALRYVLLRTASRQSGVTQQQ